MAPKKFNKNPDSKQSEKPIKSRPPLARLAKQDIECIMYAKQLKGGSKKVSEWYKIDANLPDWYPSNTKIEKTEISPEPMPQEIITPEKPVIIKPDPIEVKRKRKTTEIENIARRVLRSELGKLVIEEPPLARLAKQDIECIMYAKQLKGGSKKVSEWYKIDANLPDWYPSNTKIEKTEISPEPMPQEIITPEKPVIIKPDPIEVKRKRKTTEIENIARRVLRSELGKLVIEE
ncbi:hypothetical protein Glove_406g18 [Diversispora epigaea]|uniref:Uncharacterized protein n=1 Tax=Diversispora epigaea TaxID=1348612 RepID=A0A397H6S4_9GLOM|nr:hypothetical protein Glove_406g18 [Diversispora epigaea]